MSEKNSTYRNTWIVVILVFLIAAGGIYGWVSRFLRSLQQDETPVVRVVAPPPRQDDSRQKRIQSLFPPKPREDAAPAQKQDYEEKMRRYEEKLLERMRANAQRPPVPPPSPREQFRVSALSRDTLKNWASLPLEQSGARYIPNIVWGRPQGMRVTALDNGSFLQQIGLREGDVLLRISNKDIYSPGQAQKLYQEAARQYRNLNLRYLRDGHEHHIDLSLRDQQQ